MPENVPVDPEDTSRPPQSTESGEWTAAPNATASEAAEAIAQAEDRLLRLAAEFDNYRKRTIREKAEAFDRGGTAMVTRLLDVLDDMERLSASDAATTSYESFRAAHGVVDKKLQKELESAGLERIDPVGAPFDPTQHEAVAAAAPETDDQDHTVKATFQPGYRYKGTVIRPARVLVYSAHGVA
jgi:molecular chaperone GrpE (heat shock protein)